VILPSKHLHPEKALLSIGAEILLLLASPQTVSKLWEDAQRKRVKEGTLPITYDWFVMALDVLYMMSLIEIERGRIRKVKQ
jgi:hypothetical protein